MGKKIFRCWVKTMNIKNLNDNILTRAWKERYNAQSESIKKQLDRLYQANPSEYKLKVIKRKRIQPQEGDVFLVSPRENIYFYGKVLRANIRNAYDDWVNEENMVVIFKCKTDIISMEKYNPNYNDLLVKPTIVTKQYWSNGSFFTIDNIPLTNLEKNLDYGFYDAFNNYFISETGAKLDHQPQIICSKGISTLSGISYFIERELIIDKTLLDFNKL